MSLGNKHDVLKTVFGFDDFRRGQEQIVDHLLDGKNSLAVMPTGAGKSLTYQVPALVKGGLSLVVSPLVALMQDQVAALKLAGVNAASINSAQSRDENVRIWRAVAAGEVPILYLAPERLMTERMISALRKISLSLIAIDEAHCISQWGASFRPEYDALSQLRTSFPNTPIAAVTATADEPTRQDIVQKIFGGTAEVYVAGFDRPNIRLAVRAKQRAKDQLLDFLDDHRGNSGIVYTLSRKSSEDYAEFLTSKGFNARAYHAGLKPEDRSETQAAFMTEPDLIVCATIAFGMGIDKADVRFVFHADLPGSLDAYYQEIGRAGRDGEPAVAQMVFGAQDINLRRRFIDQEFEDSERLRREHARLSALVAYCEAPDCRRQTLLAYFGEEAKPCGNCDLCLDPDDKTDGTDIAQMVLNAVDATGNRFGATYVIEFLLGKATEKHTTNKHDQHADFGQGQDQAKTFWQSILRQMVGGGLLERDVSGFGGLSITTQGQNVLDGAAIFEYRGNQIPKPRAERVCRSTQDQAAQADVSTDLLQALKKRRTAFAAERGVPPYVIFSDKTLIDMASVKPSNREEFLTVNGVGAAKADQFCEAFLAVLETFS
ncbi:DNA helicase RecQ [Alphaproteobacteria bacterium]|nr:DNA helicase RecQ [Alphaproteobacteria bacterium]